MSGSRFAALALAAVAGWALVPTYPDYDAYHHLIWGRDLLHGAAPGFETFAAPTEHPLYIALAALLSLAGEARRPPARARDDAEPRRR